MKTKMMLIAGMLAVAPATNPAAFAATVTVNHVYNPANIMPATSEGEALATPVKLGLGDTLDLTLTFSGGATILADLENGFFNSLFTTGPASELRTSGTIEFLGASGNIVSGPIALAENNGLFQLGSFYEARLYRLDAAGSASPACGRSSRSRPTASARGENMAGLR